MSYYENVRSSERRILTINIDGYRCECVGIDGAILLYADGYFVGELYEEETEEGYIEQIKEILE